MTPLSAIKTYVAFYFHIFCYVLIYLYNLYYDHTFISNFTFFYLFSLEASCAFGGLDFPSQGSRVKVWLHSFLSRF